MTIIIDWCPSCEASGSDHATMCTVCGDTLQSRPDLRRVPEPPVRVIPDFLLRDLQESNQELTTLLSGLRERVSNIRQQASDIRDQIAELPPEAMDPQAAGSSARSRPTAKATLFHMPRITIHANSSMLQQATVQVGPTIKLEAVPGDFCFGPPPPHCLEGTPLIVAEPRTAKGGRLSETTQNEAGAAIVYMERGDNISFVRKAILAQEAGASAVVIGNNTSASWPYVMKDSLGEAKTLGLKIPVVMVKQSDGQALVKSCKETTNQTCILNIKTAAKECIICVESLCVGQTVLQLPTCAHVFHETCAMLWLKHHNSCPYCRRELPTDDEEYEAERRRTQRTHAGSEMTTSTESNGDAFYG